MSSPQSNHLSILLVGLEARSRAAVEETFSKSAQVTIIDSPKQFQNAFESWGDGIFAAIFCGPTLAPMSGSELAQVLKNQCPATPKYFLTFENTAFEARKLLKNGFNDAFFLPLDLNILRKTIREQLIAGAKDRTFRPVRIFDLAPGAVLEFDTYVYLPLNKKFVKFTTANQPLDQTKIDKLGEHQVSAVFVDQSDMEKFYQYASKRLLELGSEAMTSTERLTRLREAVRSIFSDIFDSSIKADFDEGRVVLETCTKMISNYITKGASSDWHERLRAAFNENKDGYDHAMNTSTFAALFAIGLGHGNPEDLALAGLFHDIGMSALPEELLNKAESEMTPEELALFQSHPEKSLNLVKSKRIILSAEVERAILQHHEKFSGHGFPKQLPGNRLSLEAQILSFANQFDRLTQVVEGRLKMSPLQAFDEIKRTGSIDPNLLGQIRTLLAKDIAAPLEARS